MNLLNPEPGDYQLPLMLLARATGTESPDVIRLEFETTDPRASGGRQSGRTQPRLTISVPIPVLEAAGLLRTLRKLQELGKIQTVAEPHSDKKKN